MIVCSKKCFLNVLTQLMDKNTILQANYYIADVKTPNGVAQIGDCISYDDEGHLVTNSAMVAADALRAPAAIGKYFIKYGTGELDPTPFLTSMLMGVQMNYANSVDLLIQHLNNTDTLLATYEFLFSHPVRGNGLQILIFNDERFINDYVYLVCEYLCRNFGVDITYIDPAYHNVKGSTEYKCPDIEFAKKTIRDLRDVKLLVEFNRVVSFAGADESMSNLTTWLSAFNIQDLIYLYNLIFPQDPLPPDNYTIDHLKQIIIMKTTQNLPKNPFTNLHMSDDYFEMIRRYEQEAEDFSQDDDMM